MDDLIEKHVSIPKEIPPLVEYWRNIDWGLYEILNSTDPALKLDDRATQLIFTQMRNIIHPYFFNVFIDNPTYGSHVRLRFLTKGEYMYAILTDFEAGSPESEQFYIDYKKYHILGVPPQGRFQLVTNTSKLKVYQYHNPKTTSSPQALFIWRHLELALDEFESIERESLENRTLT